MRRLLAVLGAAAALGCHGLFMDDPPEDTPAGNFEALWRGFDRYYCFFPSAGMDWQAAHDAYRPRVTEQLSDAELFDLLAEMTDLLRDGHVAIASTGSPHSYFDRLVEQYPQNSDPAARNRALGASLRGDGLFTWGDLPGNLGYLSIARFSSGDFGAVDGILSGMADRAGLVVDVRDNPGGNSDNADLVASRFADRERRVRYWVTRSGPGHGDLTTPEAFFLQPGGVRFAKPVAVLTNRRTFSAAEAFVAAMRTFPQVTVVGDVTGGGAGSPVIQRLPNGWRVWVPRAYFLDSQAQPFQGIGLSPGVRVDIAPADAAAGRDTILETAIQRLARAP